MTDPTTSLRRARARMAPPEPAFDRLLDRRRVRRRTSKIASIAMAFVVVGAGAAGAVIAFGGTGSAHHGGMFGGGHGYASGPNLVAGPGQYYYSRTQIYEEASSLGQPGNGIEGPWTVELWFGTDASGRAVYVNAPHGASYGRGPSDSTYGPGQMPLEDLSSLPTDPNQLYDHLVTRSMPGGASPNPIPTSSPGRSEQNTALLRSLQDLFDGAEQFTPPAVRGAMFDVASRVDGVETLQGVTDPVGRPAVGLRWVVFYPAGRTPSYVEWYFDPSTKQLMAETWTQDGKVLQARVVTEAGIADSTSASPSSQNEFFPVAGRTPDFVNR